MSRPDMFQLIAADRGLPAGWQWFKSECKGEKPNLVFLVTGGVDGGVFQRGKNKGRPNPKLRTHVTELVITWDQLRAREIQWERDTGLCHRCGDEKVETISVSVTEGRKTRPCSRCKGTGKAVTSCTP